MKCGGNYIVQERLKALKNSPNQKADRETLTQRRKEKAHQLAVKWMKQVGIKVLSKAKFIEHCIVRNEIIRGKRFSVDELWDLNECCKQNFFEQILVFDNKMARKVANLHTEWLQELAAGAASAEELDDLKEMWDDASRTFNRLAAERLRNFENFIALQTQDGLKVLRT